MKKIFTMLSILALLFVVCVPRIFAQTTAPQEKIVVNVSDLTATQLAKVKADEQLKLVEQKIETYGKWAGAGKEIGIAVREGLTAVVDVAEKFSKTDVGTFTLAMIAWKVMGKDLIRMSVGIILILIIITVGVRSYVKTCMPRRVVVSSGGLFGKKEYQYLDPVYGKDNNDLGNAQTFHVVIIVLALGAVCLMMFV